LALRSSSWPTISRTNACRAEFSEGVVQAEDDGQQADFPEADRAEDGQQP